MGEHGVGETIGLAGNYSHVANIEYATSVAGEAACQSSEGELIAEIEGRVEGRVHRNILEGKEQFESRTGRNDVKRSVYVLFMWYFEV